MINYSNDVKSSFVSSVYMWFICQYVYLCSSHSLQSSTIVTKVKRVLNLGLTTLLPVPLLRNSILCQSLPHFPTSYWRRVGFKECVKCKTMDSRNITKTVVCTLNSKYTKLGGLVSLRFVKSSKWVTIKRILFKITNEDKEC